MRLYLMAFAALLPAAAEASASGPMAWTFEYTGFLNQTTGMFDPAATLSGSFAGQDLDGDNVIELPELTSFVFAGREFVMQYYCNYDQYLRCEFNSFTYADGALHFDLTWWGNDEAVSGWGGSAVAGETFYGYSYRESEEWVTRYAWTPATTFSIDPPPSMVPEPQSAAMLGLGLAGFALVSSRRKRAHMQC